VACTCVRGDDVAALSASGSSRGIVSESTLLPVERVVNSVEEGASEGLGPVSSQDAAALPRQEAEVGRRFSGLLRVFGSASDIRFRWSKRAMPACGLEVTRRAWHQ
jgi:hypothetical protein